MFEGSNATKSPHSNSGSALKESATPESQKQYSSTGGSLLNPYSMLLHYPTRSLPRNFSRRKGEEWTSMETEVARARVKRMSSNYDIAEEASDKSVSAAELDDKIGGITSKECYHKQNEVQSSGARTIDNFPYIDDDQSDAEDRDKIFLVSKIETETFEDSSVINESHFMTNKRILDGKGSNNESSQIKYESHIESTQTKDKSLIKEIEIRERTLKNKMSGNANLQEKSVQYCEKLSHIVIQCPKQK